MTTVFRYRAARPNGSIVLGWLTAAETSEVWRILDERGLNPITIQSAGHVIRPRKRASRQALAVLFRAVATFVKAGVPLERALAASERLANRHLAGTLREARQALREGKTLGSALAGDGGVMPRVVIGMIAAGEHAGRLGAALEQVAEHLEREADLISRTRQALVYPMLLAAAGSVSVAMLVGIVIPRFAALVADAGGTLPVTTRLLLETGAALRENWLFLMLVLAMSVGFVRWILSNPSRRLEIERNVLAIPALGALRHAFAGARLTTALGGMLQAGVPLSIALERSGEAVSNPAIAARLQKARAQIVAGEPVTRAFTANLVVPESLLPVIAIGEEAGQLGPMLERAGVIAAQDVERRLSALVKIAEPALVLLFGAIVALVAMALLQAVYSLRPI